jgi:methylenetetrahydrofolate--tRNA-(uracil-5-)-methyltransferase
MEITIIGGGLAGCEAAWQAAKAGSEVRLYEMRPLVSTGAHVSSNLAELVCSNSLGSKLPDRASGLLMAELRKSGSLLLECAEKTALPAGGSLAVDRNAYSNLVTNVVSSHPRIHLIREEVREIPDGVVLVASGPLTSAALSASLMRMMGVEYFFFYDALAPILERDSINMEIAYRGSRYGRGVLEEGDYINCPFTKEEYSHFISQLVSAERIMIKDFETNIKMGVRAGAKEYFEGCLPVEVLAERDEKALAFGPMRPVGLRDPKTGQRSYAVIQLRQDNLVGSLYNMVGFQTNLTFPEQKRIFQLIPGLEHASFVRYGQMHRNTFLASPRLLKPTLQYFGRDDLFFAGQITGVEGYLGNIATGLVAGINAVQYIRKATLLEFPATTMIGALCQYITHAELKDFQPMKANFGLLPALTGEIIKDKRVRNLKLGERSQRDLEIVLKTLNESVHETTQ